MTRESDWQEEWAALRAERETARRRWCGAASGLAERARDPFGLRALVRAHPLATGGIVAGVIAFVMNRIRAKHETSAATPAGPDESAPSNGKDRLPPRTAPSLLRELAIGFGVPWLLRFLEGLREPDAPAEAVSADPPS